MDEWIDPSLTLHRLPPRTKQKPAKDWLSGPRFTMDDMIHCRNGMTRIPAGELHLNSRFRPIVIQPRAEPSEDDPLGMCT
jgi:hypothetical protein